LSNVDNGKCDKCIQVDIDKDEILFDDEIVIYKEFTYLMLNKPKDYLRAMQELEKIFRSKEDEKPNTDRASHEINLYTAMGFHNLNSSNGFGDNRFKTAGSKTFEISAFTLSFNSKTYAFLVVSSIF